MATQMHPAGMPPMDEATLQDILRRTKFAHLSQAQFDLLMGTCLKRGLDPWLDHVHCEPKPGGKRNEITMVVTLQALRDLAETSGEYDSPLGPSWCGRNGLWQDVWTSSKPPAAARVGVIRVGRKQPAWGIANWDAFAQYGTPVKGKDVLADFWKRMGPHMLAKCAEALALRKAFPRILAGLFTTDEMGQAHNPRTIQVPMCPVIDDATPTSDFLFHKRLVSEFELANAAERDRVIEGYKAKYPALWMEDRRAFYATVIFELNAAKNRGPGSA